MATALWTAFDVSSIATNVQTILVAGVGITVGFVVYKFIKRGGRVM